MLNNLLRLAKYANERDISKMRDSPCAKFQTHVRSAIPGAWTLPGHCPEHQQETGIFLC
jgi:hypothetical protein